MPCSITFAVVSEALTGSVGVDWEYTITARVLNPEVTGSATRTVAKHRLEPGATHMLPPEDLTIDAGECATTPTVELAVVAAEKDLFLDDEAMNVMVVQLSCGEPGSAADVVEREIAVRVNEAPGVMGGSAELYITVRLSAQCVGVQA